MTHTRVAAARAAATGGPILQCLGGAALLASIFQPLARHGPGSAMDIRGTADLLLSGTVDAWAPRWVGLALYLPAAIGALMIMLAGLDGRVARLSAVALGVLLLGVIVAISTAGADGIVGRAGPGFGLIAGGAVFAALGAVATALSARRLS